MLNGQRSCCLLLLLCVFWTAGHSCVAETPLPRESWLVVGQGWAQVRELYEARVVPGIQRLDFEDIPEEADASSFVLRARRQTVRLLLLERPDYRDDVDAAQEEGLVIWPMPDAGPPQRANRISCRVEASAREKILVELTYMVTGITWSAHYQLRTRGDIREGGAEVFSVDLAGYAMIENRTGKTWDDAVVHVVGNDAQEPNRQPKPPGFLVLSESPLSDLWRESPPEQKPEYRYPLAGRHSLPGHGQLTATLVEAIRIPAERYLVGRPQPDSSKRGKGIPLRETIQFANDSASGLGSALPGGRVVIHRAGALADQITFAKMGHVAPNSRVEMDLGADPRVVAYRERVARRREASPGTYRDDHSIRVANRRDQAVSFIIEERPEESSSWTVYSSTVPYERQGGTLIFKARAEASGELQVDYTLSVRRRAF